MSARFVGDTSVVLPWCFEDEGHGYAEAVLESLESGEAFVPAGWPLEAGNVLLVAERKKRLGQASVVAFSHSWAVCPSPWNRNPPSTCSRKSFRSPGNTDFQPVTPPTWTLP